MRLPKLDDFIPYNELFTAATEERHLKTLLTPPGERTVYDSIVQCNRCGLCQESCPTYLMTGRENYSPRGRNQLLRMAMSGRLRLETDKKELADAMYSCLLCGACAGACHSAVPTPEHALEGRRVYPEKGAPASLRLVIKKLALEPQTLRAKAKLFNLARKSGVPNLLARAGFFKAVALPWLGEWLELNTAAPFHFLDDLLKNSPVMSRADHASRTACVYFASCSANYLYPRTGLATISLADRFIGPVRVISGACCGFNCYLHGDIADARAAVKKIIFRHEEICAGAALPLVTDCGECAAFLKRAEQLFAGDDAWRPRAKTFAACVRDSLEIIEPEKYAFLLANREALPAKADCARKPTRPVRADIRTARIVFHENASGAHWQHAARRAKAALKAAFGPRLVELGEASLPSGAEFGYPLLSPDGARELLRRTVRNIAAAQADIVVTGSHASAAHIARGLRKYYPRAQAVHCSVLLDEALKG